MDIFQEKYNRKNMLTVRTAKDIEIRWVNKCYDEVGFIHSNFDKEIIAIGEIESSKFRPCINHDLVPKELLDKYLWCKEKYPQPTIAYSTQTDHQFHFKAFKKY